MELKPRLQGTALVEPECMRGSGRLFKKKQKQKKKQVVAHSGHPLIYRLASLVPSKQVNELGLQDTPSQGRRCDKICRKSPVLLPGEPGLQAAQPGASCSFTCRSPPPTASNPGGKGAGPAREVFHFVFTARGQLFLSPDTSLSSPPPPARDSRRVKAPLLPRNPRRPGSPVHPPDREHHKLVGATLPGGGAD